MVSFDRASPQMKKGRSNMKEILQQWELKDQLSGRAGVLPGECLQSPNTSLALHVHRNSWKSFLAHFLYVSALLQALPDEELSSSDKSSSVKTIPVLCNKGAV